MNELEQKQLIEESADKAVKKTFAILGVDINDPAEVEEFRQDLRFSSRMRAAMDKGFMAFTAAVAVAMAAAMWAAIVGKVEG